MKTNLVGVANNNPHNFGSPISEDASGEGKTQVQSSRLLTEFKRVHGSFRRSRGVFSIILRALLE